MKYKVFENEESAKNYFTEIIEKKKADGWTTAVSMPPGVYGASFVKHWKDNPLKMWLDEIELAASEFPYDAPMCVGYVYFERFNAEKKRIETARDAHYAFPLA